MGVALKAVIWVVCALELGITQIFVYVPIQETLFCVEMDGDVADGFIIFLQNGLF